MWRSPLMAQWTSHSEGRILLRFGLGLGLYYVRVLHSVALGINSLLTHVIDLVFCPRQRTTCRLTSRPIALSFVPRRAPSHFSSAIRFLHSFSQCPSFPQ